ncbi:hypothetical protein EPAKOI_004900 [Cupriavidus sp. H18C2]
MVQIATVGKQNLVALSPNPSPTVWERGARHVVGDDRSRFQAPALSPNPSPTVWERGAKTNQTKPNQTYNAISSTRATWMAWRPVPSWIWWRQLVPSATTSVSASALRTAGSSDSSPIFIETAWCSAS